MISEKIVVIDDDPRIIKSIKLAFPEYEFIDFSDGEEALTYLKKPNNINVVLLDFMMPKMDGISVLSEIKKHMSNTAVILMTGTLSCGRHMTAILPPLENPLPVVPAGKRVSR